MRSPTILLLLTAFIGMVSGTIYFKNVRLQAAQTQVNLVLQAFNHNDIVLLSKLIKIDGKIHNYLKAHRNQIESVDIVQVNEFGDRTFAAGYVNKVQGHISRSPIRLSFIPSARSPTGLFIDKARLCRDEACSSPTNESF